MVDKNQLSATVSQQNSSFVSVTGCWPSMVRPGVGSIGSGAAVSWEGQVEEGVNAMLSSVWLFIIMQASRLTVHGQGHKQPLIRSLKG